MMPYEVMNIKMTWEWP